MGNQLLEELRNWKMDLNDTLVLNGHEISEELKRKTRKYRDIMECAIEQAEQVQDLEREHKKYVEFVEANNFNISVEMEKLYKQNKRYRESIKKALHEMPNGYTNKAIMILHQTLEEEKLK